MVNLLTSCLLIRPIAIAPQAYSRESEAAEECNSDGADETECMHLFYVCWCRPMLKPETWKWTFSSSEPHDKLLTLKHVN